MAELDEILTDDHIVVADASYASIWICNNLVSRKPGMRFLTPRGMAGLGWGLPMALGAKLARPEAPVFALVGDGGFAHVWSELETARRQGLHVVVTVLNNQNPGVSETRREQPLRRPHRRRLLHAGRSRRHCARLRLSRCDRDQTRRLCQGFERSF